MGKVVFLLPALTFPAQAGISPHGAVACSGVQDGSRGCPGTLKLFHGEWAGGNPKTSTWLSLAPANPPKLPPGNTTHGQGTAPGIRGQPPGTDPQGWEREGGLHPVSDAGDYFCARPKQTCQPRRRAWEPASLEPHPLGSIPAETTSASGRRPPGLPALGHPSIPIRESLASHQQRAGHWAGAGSVLGVMPVFCISSKPRFRGPGHSAQPEMERVTVHINKTKIISKRKNTHKTCPLDI